MVRDGDRGESTRPDLSDAEWKLVRRLVPQRRRKAGRRSTTAGRLSTPFDTWSVQGAFGGHCRTTFRRGTPVFKYFTAWRETGVWKRQIHDQLRGDVREAEGRRCDIPKSAGIMDSQSVKTTERGPRGYDAGKKASVDARDTSSSTRSVSSWRSSSIPRTFRIVTARSSCSWSPCFFAQLPAPAPHLGGQRTPDSLSSGYETSGATFALSGGWRSMKRSDDVRGFKVLPRRWSSGAPSADSGRFRRMSKDYEFHATTSEGHDSHRR